MTFTNPVDPAPSADPWVIFKDGYYYYCKSEMGGITVTKSRRLTGIAEGEKKLVWQAPATGMNSKEIWAPELHWLHGKWYIYYAADDGDNANHRMWVLESTTSDAQGSYVDKGKITDPTDRWAIDGTVLEMHDGQLYFIWSGWHADINDQQNIYIAPMSNPWTISGDRVLLSEPEYSWEKITYRGGCLVNEGPQVLQGNGRIFIIYSASHSVTPDYCLGMLSAPDTANLLDPASWTKFTEPVFRRNDEQGVFGVGHASFTTSPDGTEDWIAYHGMDTDEGGWHNRSSRLQPFTWHADRTPNFGQPVASNTPLPLPSGE